MRLIRTPSTRFVLAAACLTFVGLAAGCSDSTSPSARAWERATVQSRASANPIFNDHGQMIACDGLGSSVFAPADAPAMTQTGATFANVPTE